MWTADNRAYYEWHQLCYLMDKNKGEWERVAPHSDPVKPSSRTWRLNIRKTMNPALNMLSSGIL